MIYYGCVSSDRRVDAALAAFYSYETNAAEAAATVFLSGYFLDTTLVSLPHEKRQGVPCQIT